MNITNLLTNIKKEEERNDTFLHLTANEPLMFDTARSFMDSRLADRYFIGPGTDEKVDLGPFTALGFPGIHELVTTAEEATKKILGASHVSLSCLSGVHAMMCAILSTTEPGDAVMTVHHDHGGHFATKGILDRVGRKHVFASYNFDSLSFDVERLSTDFKKSNAKAFYMDVSYYINPHNLMEIRQALGDEAIIIYDASHTMGLILGQEFQSPFSEGADVICANTHKTLPGPQKGMIAFKDDKLGSAAMKVIDGCLYSSPHAHHVIALAVTLLEMAEFGEAYAGQIIANSNTLGEELERLGYSVRKANTGRLSENHQVHLFTDKVGNYKQLYDQLFDNNITVNFDNPLEGGMFVRLGTQEITRRGMKEAEVKKVAEYIDQSFKGTSVRAEVLELVRAFQTAHYSFDTQGA